QPNLQRDWQYRPCRLAGTQAKTVKTLWTHTIPFQKVQRVAHGETDNQSLVDYLQTRIGPTDRALALYSGDAEIFGFRPGRFKTEAILHHDEWARLRALFDEIAAHEAMRFIAPMRLLERDDRDAERVVDPATADCPIPVKKQPKYNVARWAASGRDDFRLNAAAHQASNDLAKTTRSSPVSPAEIKAMLDLWRSDYRTHLTEARWQRLSCRLAPTPIAKKASAQARTMRDARAHAPIVWEESDRSILIKTRSLILVLNKDRGLALTAAAPAARHEEPLLGTLPHGTFDDIRFAFDWYSGHLVYERPGEAKITDLASVRPVITPMPEALSLTATLETALGPLRKQVTVHTHNPTIDISYTLDFDFLPPGSLRLGHVTLHPKGWKQDCLAYETHNGGPEAERFALRDTMVDHGSATTFLVSTKNVLGMTEGQLDLTDGRHRLRLSVDKTQTPLFGLISHRQVDGIAFTRACLTARELDETCRPVTLSEPRHLAYRLSLFSETTP
ncbi:MAG: hypothetical protein AAGB03_05890, partial [Pseudomonadota bacterium]